MARVLVKIHRKVESVDQDQLQQPWPGIFDPSYGRVIGHPARQVMLGRSKSHYRSPADSSEFEPKEATDREAQGRSFCISPVMVAKSRPESRLVVSRPARSDADVQKPSVLDLDASLGVDSARSRAEIPPVDAWNVGNWRGARQNLSSRVQVTRMCNCFDAAIGQRYLVQSRVL